MNKLWCGILSSIHLIVYRVCMYKGNNRYYQGHTVPRPFSLPMPAWCPVQKLRPIFLVDKSIHDEAISFKNNLVNLTIPTAGVSPIVVLFSMS